MKKQVCSSLLALTMTLGTVTPALAAETETETNVQSAACTCTAACTEETRNMDCAVCAPASLRKGRFGREFFHLRAVLYAYVNNLHGFIIHHFGRNVQKIFPRRVIF